VRRYQCVAHLSPPDGLRRGRGGAPNARDSRFLPLAIFPFNVSGLGPIPLGNSIGDRQMACSRLGGARGSVGELDAVVGAMGVEGGTSLVASQNEPWGGGGRVPPRTD